jgi:hypothetical protein
MTVAPGDWKPGGSALRPLARFVLDFLERINAATNLKGTALEFTVADFADPDLQLLLKMAFDIYKRDTEGWNTLGAMLARVLKKKAARCKRKSRAGRRSTSPKKRHRKRTV